MGNTEDPNVLVPIERDVNQLFVQRDANGSDIVMLVQLDVERPNQITWFGVDCFVCLVIHGL